MVLLCGLLLFAPQGKGFDHSLVHFLAWGKRAKLCSDSCFSDFADLEAEDIRVCIACAARYVDHTVPATS